ncbi:MAG: hypothetical protein HY202_07205, partial [Nitrospirae bacterium]|nr:hypothetical protein [Nitrospirota bacterium]
MQDKQEETSNKTHPFNKKEATNLKGFWQEVAQTAPKAWLITSLIGIIAVILSFPADIQTFKDKHLVLALALRIIILVYFLINVLIALQNPKVVKHYFQAFMTSFLYVTGIPMAVLSVLGGTGSHLYFMGIVEIEFAAATFFTISRGKLIAGISVVNVFYILINLLWGEWTSLRDFTNVWVSLLIFGVVAAYAHHTILQYKTGNYLKQQALLLTQNNISAILSRITDAFFALDNSWRFTFFNREAENLLLRMRRSKEVLLGKSLWEEFPNMSDSTMRNELLQSKEKNCPVQFEESYPLMGLHMEVHAYPAPEGISVYMHDISARKIAEAALRESNQELEIRVSERTAELRQLAVYTDNLREEEWKNISREIHDELGQALSGFNLDIDWLKDHLGEIDILTEKKLRLMSNNTKEMVASIRRIASQMRPAALDDLGLAAAVEWYTGIMQAKCEKIRFVCRIEPEEIIIDPDRASALFRVLQEGLNNAVRHSRAGHINVSLLQTDRSVCLEIADDGIGFKVNSDPPGTKIGGGLGLLGMKERANRFGGDFIMNS